MLTLIEGSARTDAHEKILSEIASAIEAGQECFLIVPEQQTVEAEAEAAKRFPQYAPRFFEATNFSRFADRVFRLLGGVGTERCDGGRKQILMWRTLNELSGVLKGTRSARITVGGVERALAGVHEIRSLGIGADELAAAADSDALRADPRLAGKLRDLAAVEARFSANLSENRYAVGDELLRLSEILALHPEYVEGKMIFVEGFTSFTQPQEKLLGILMQHGDVTVATGLPTESRDAFEYRELARSRDSLLHIADTVGSRKKSVKSAWVCGKKPQILDELPGLLWRVGGCLSEEALQSAGAVRVIEAADPFEECEFLAADIASHIRNGEKYSDIAVIARHIDAYDGILDVALKEAGIPLFSTSKSRLSDLEGVKVIFAAYRVLLGNFKAEDVIAFLKCGFSALSERDADELELYIEKWQIEGSRFTDGKPWAMNPDGFTDRRAPDIEEKLARIHASRVTTVAPLLALWQDNAGEKTVRERAEALFGFLTALGVEKKLKARAKALTAMGEAEKAEENRRLFGLLSSGLDTLVELCGDMTIDVASFPELLRLLFSTMSVGRIPALADSVTAGSADQIRLREKKHVYLLGVNDGRFPAVPEETSYFTDREKTVLSAAGLAALPDGDLLAAREMYSFTRAFSFAGSDVTFLYEKADASRKALAPAEVIGRILSLTGGAVKVERLSELPIYARIGSVFAALAYRADRADWETVREALRLVGGEDRLAERESPLQNMDLLLSPDSVALLFPEGHISMSPSSLEDFLTCPMQYYCKNDLRLERGEAAGFNAANIGTFYHAVFENFFRTLQEKNVSAAQFSKEDRDALIERVSQVYFDRHSAEKAVGGARLDHQIGRLKNVAKIIVEGMCDEFADCRFLPAFFELRIKDRNKPGSDRQKSETDHSPDSLQYSLPGGGSVAVGGVIDRVDTLKDGEDVYVRVIDYKTGRKEFSPRDLDEGHNLQMFLYLDAIRKTENAAFREELGVGEQGKIIPAGVIYVKAASEDVGIPHDSGDDAVIALKKMQKRLGMIGNYGFSLQNMNKDFIPVRFTKDGEVSKTSAGNLYPADGWESLMEKVENAVVRVATKIREGDISAFSNAKIAGNSICTSCQYSSICRNPCAKSEKAEDAGGEK